MYYNNNRKTLNWFLRLLMWPFILLNNERNTLSSENGIFSDVTWFSVGISSLVVPVVIVLSEKVFIFGDIVLSSVITIVLYLVSGVLCFFSEKVTNAGIPWQNNGRW